MVFRSNGPTFTDMISELTYSVLKVVQARGSPRHGCSSSFLFTRSDQRLEHINIYQHAQSNALQPRGIDTDLFLQTRTHTQFPASDVIQASSTEVQTITFSSGSWETCRLVRMPRATTDTGTK